MHRKRTFPATPPVKSPYRSGSPPSSSDVRASCTVRYFQEPLHELRRTFASLRGLLQCKRQDRQTVPWHLADACQHNSACAETSAADCCHTPAAKLHCKCITNLPPRLVDKITKPVVWLKLVTVMILLAAQCQVFPIGTSTKHRCSEQNLRSWLKIAGGAARQSEDPRMLQLGPV